MEKNLQKIQRLSSPILPQKPRFGLFCLSTSGLLIRFRFLSLIHIYNRRFFNNAVGVSAGFYFHYDGVGLGLQQILKVSVNLQKTVYRPKK